MPSLTITLFTAFESGDFSSFIVKSLLKAQKVIKYPFCRHGLKYITGKERTSLHFKQFFFIFSCGFLLTLGAPFCLKGVLF